MDDLKALIEQAVERKQGNREFALFYDGEGAWWAEIGNPAHFVTLGESAGEFCGEGATAEDAVRALIAVLPTT